MKLLISDYRSKPAMRKHFMTNGCYKYGAELKTHDVKGWFYCNH